MSQIKEELKQTNYFYEAAGNTFFINYENTLNNNKEIKERSQKIFDRYSNFDTLLYLARLRDNYFKYLVIERDGSWSEMCGNGCRAVAKFIYDNNLSQPALPIVLITNSNKKIVVTELKNNSETWYDVDMGEVTDLISNPSDFCLFLGKDFDWRINPQLIIKKEFEKYTSQPNLLDHIYPNKIGENNQINNPLCSYSNYFLNHLTLIKNNTNDQQEFGQFISTLKFNGLYQSGGEPHTLIEISNNKLKQKFGDIKFADFLKISSFLLRFSSDNNDNKNYPLAMNFMFYQISNNNKVMMYPAERGVHNGINFDQTGACGTGSTCLGAYLFNSDIRFVKKKEIIIQNRSGVNLVIQKKYNNLHLIGQAKQTDITPIH